MSRELGVVIIAAIGVLAFTAIFLGWSRRSRRDGHLQPPFGAAPEGAAVVGEFPGYYVASTPHDDPLNRLALRSLGFRARGTVLVTDAGVLLRLNGEPEIFLAAADLVGVGAATWTIDRVVEPGGLTMLAWKIAPEQTVVDSYFRFDGGTTPFVDAVRTILPAPAPAGPVPAPTGNDA